MSSKDKPSKDKKEKIFQLDITNFEELQNLVFQYFFILSEFVKDQNIDIKKIKMDIDSNKIMIEGVDSEPEKDSEESTECDFEWV